MHKNTISAAAVINDFNRRKIQPDWIHEVKQGHLRVWLFCNSFIAELYVGSNEGQSIPGTLQILGRQSYANTHSPQDIADDLMVESQLTKYDLYTLTPSQMGKLGGSKKSEAKSASSRANGKLGGRPRKVKDA